MTKFRAVCAVAYLPLALATLSPAQAQDAPPADAARAADTATIGDIVVTARRRSESLQKVPVAVTAFTGEGLRERNILSTIDLTYSTPGVNLGQSGGSFNVAFTIRGQTKTPVGNGQQSVVVYLNEVPLPNFSSNVTPFDIGSVQILKGPQGTFFGRNTTGGAVLYSTEAPSYNYGGYVQATYGSYDRKELEGAINLPLVADRIAFRFAGLIARRDGYIDNLSGPDLADRHEDAFRMSLLVEPTDWLKSTTVFDHSRRDEIGAGSLLANTDFPNAPYRSTAAFFPGGPSLATFFDCNTSVACDVDLKAAQQKAFGTRKTDQGTAFVSDVKSLGVSNTTVADLGGVTVKNIFGYRAVKFLNRSNSGSVDINLLRARYIGNREQFSNETQVSGNLLDGRLNWMLGGFYLNSRPGGKEGLGLDLFRPAIFTTAQWAPDVITESYVHEKSKALFIQLGYDLSSLVEGLRFNGGFRYTWDRSSGCVISQTLDAELLGDAGCKAAARSSVLGSKSKRPTWTVGLEWQATSDIFAYVTSRRGYKAGSFNTPALGTVLAPFQTFDPETITDVELGTKANWRAGGMSGRINIAAFRGWYNNIQANQRVSPNIDGDNNPANDPANTTLLVNRGKAILQGLEGEFIIRPVPGLSLNAGAAYLDRKYTDFTPIPIFASLASGSPKFENAPKYTLNLGADYSVPLGDGIGSLLLHGDYYTSSEVEYGDYLAKGYQIVNVRIDLKDIGGMPIDAGVFARNLLQKAYVVGQSAANSGLGIHSVLYGEPRMFGAQLRYRFGG